MLNSLSQYINIEHKARLVPELLVPVRIKDAKSSYGRIRYLITPVNGDGEVWIEGFKLGLPSSNLELENSDLLITKELTDKII